MKRGGVHCSLKIERGGSFRYERLLCEKGFSIFVRTNGENGSKSRVGRELTRKKNGTYFLETT
jgi:hypothetical protein